MDDDVQQAQPAVPRRGRGGRVLATVEATASVFCAFVIGFVVMLVGGIAAVFSYRDEGVTWVLPAGVALTGAEAAFLLWLKRGLEKTLRIPELALRQRRWPLPLRPLMAAWWLAHAGVAGWATWLLEQSAGWEPAALWRSPLLLAAFVFGVFTVSHTTHLYVLLCITALRRSERAVYLWWRYRFAVDAAVIALTFLLPASRGA